MSKPVLLGFDIFPTIVMKWSLCLTSLLVASPLGYGSTALTAAALWSWPQAERSHLIGRETSLKVVSLLRMYLE